VATARHALTAHENGTLQQLQTQKNREGMCGYRNTMLHALLQIHVKSFTELKGKGIPQQQ
jgi:hypothetical protein